MDINKVNEIIKANRFPEPTEPTIVCFRNTDINHNEVKDTSMNNTCIYYLVDKDSISQPLTGRSYANANYQAKMVKGIDKANKIASGFYKSAWTHGLHFGCRALRQNRSFLIIRSLNMKFGDLDDYNEYNIVADDFHGWAPASAGCCTVVGAMKKVDDSEEMKIIPPQEPSMDWAIVDKWLYEKHVNDRYFTAVILEHDDLDLKPRVRFGSIGDDVKNVQTRIGVGSDGDFGQTTHSYLKMYQRKNNINPADGIWVIK